MRVVISAYACEPGETSERGIGWAWTKAAAERHDVSLVTRAKFESSIRGELDLHPELSLALICIDPPHWVTFWKRGKRGLYLYYLIWQICAWRRIGQLHRRQRFDVGHHLTFAIDWLPAGVAFVRGLPVVWGPVGPGPVWPRLRLARWLGTRWLLTDLARGIVTSAGRSIFGRTTATRAAVVVANNADVARQYAAHRNVVIEQHAFVDVPGVSAAGREGEEHHAIFVGRLIAWKGVDLAIEAIRRTPGWRLSVVGEGGAEGRLRRRVQESGLDERVAFLGRVSHGEVFEALAGADVLLFPSTRDNAPGVVAEAISIGLPVICLDVCGPGSMVGPGQGLKVPPTGDVVRGLASALAEAPQRHEGSQRWDVDRLGPLLDQWYRDADAPSMDRATPL